MISIVIPTHNRKDILLECLAAFAGQDFSGTFEIVLVDDGSDDGTREAILENAGSMRLELRYLRQENKGPAAARNLGIKNSAGDILLFTGDDMIPERDMLKEHAAFHAAHTDGREAMLGLAAWDPRVHPSPFAFWLENGGPQFGFGKFYPGEKVSAFWTANISLKKSFLEENGVFDEDFKYPAGEDVELGMRLKKKGLEITYNPKAIVRHFHRITFSSYCRRQEQAGSALGLLEKKHTEAAQAPHLDLPFWKRFISAAAPVLKTLIDILDAAGIPLDPRWYDIVLSYYFAKGRRGMQR